MINQEIAFKTADFLQSNPHLYRFMKVVVPSTDRAEACVLGWLAVHAGLRRTGLKRILGQRFVHRICPGMLGIDAIRFYKRMCVMRERTRGEGDWESWHNDANVAAQCLRAYARTYMQRA